MKKLFNIKLPLRVWLLYLVVLSFMATGVTFSKYIASSEGEDSARAARFSFAVEEKEIDGDKIIDLSEITKPGDSKTITLQASNKDDKGVSEVKEQYVINLSHAGSMPLEYSAEAVSSDTYEVQPVITEGEKCSINGIFLPSTEETHEYKITVKWPEDENDSKYASGNGISSLTISMIGEQIQ